MAIRIFQIFLCLVCAFPCLAIAQTASPECTSCSIVVELEASLGDASRGVVDYNQLAVRIGSKIFVSHASSVTRVQVFDSRGEFERSFGRAGEGPSEFGAISDLLAGPDGDLWVIDQGNLALKVFTTDGIFVSSRPLPFRPGFASAIVLPDSSLIVNALVPTAELIGYWTHRWHPRKGLLWSASEASTVARGRLEPREYAANDSTLWIFSRSGAYSIERVDLRTGQTEDRFSLARPWFDDFQDERVVEGSGHDPDAVVTPVAWITDARIVEGLLWVLGYTADSRWRSATEGSFRNLGGYLDNVIDIYDPQTTALLASHRIDIPNTLLTDFLTSHLIFGHETNPVVDRLSIYRLRAIGPLPVPSLRR